MILSPLQAAILSPNISSYTAREICIKASYICVRVFYMNSGRSSFDCTNLIMFFLANCE